MKFTITIFRLGSEHAIPVTNITREQPQRSNLMSVAGDLNLFFHTEKLPYVAHVESEQDNSNINRLEVPDAQN